jgi:type II secretory pathway pseudopilin PulG
MTSTRRIARWCGDERGETLPEILVTIAIVSLAVVILVGGLATGIAASAGHRQHASADTIARSVAEAVKDRKANPTLDSTYSYDSEKNSVDHDGFNVTVDRKCLNSVDNQTVAPGDFSSCGSGVSSLQYITVTVTSTGAKSEHETVSILKRRS